MHIFDTMCFKMRNKIICYCQSNNELGFHSESTKLYDAIDCVLPMN